MTIHVIVVLSGEYIMDSESEILRLNMNV